MTCKGGTALFQICQVLIPRKLLVTFGASTNAWIAFIRKAKLSYTVFAHYVATFSNDRYLLMDQSLLTSPANVLMEVVLIQFETDKLLQFNGMGCFVIMTDCRALQLLVGWLYLLSRSHWSIIRCPEAGLDPFFLLFIPLIFKCNNRLLVWLHFIDELYLFSFGLIQLT